MKLLRPHVAGRIFSPVHGLAAALLWKAYDGSESPLPIEFAEILVEDQLLGLVWSRHESCLPLVNLIASNICATSLSQGEILDSSIIEKSFNR